MPSLYVIAGPNGAGKTTFIKRFAPRELALPDFLNADEIARGLSPFDPFRAQLEAGRIVLTRFRQFVAEARDFCLETTLSGRTYRRLFEEAKARDYHIQLDYLMLPTVEHSIRRVADRVEAGGHDVPEGDLRRRFKVSLQNLFSIYRPVVNKWTLHSNEVLRPRVLAYGTADEIEILDQSKFDKIRAEFSLTV
jgi:predicted ABC-type ATPase